jgi:hypothetical protein
MKYTIKGIALVPAEAQLIIEADTREQALALAQEEFKRNPSRALISNSYDDCAAFDWLPCIEKETP